MYGRWPQGSALRRATQRRMSRYRVPSLEHLALGLQRIQRCAASLEQRAPALGQLDTLARPEGVVVVVVITILARLTSSSISLGTNLRLA